jgi:hypothetical protein
MPFSFSAADRLRSEARSDFFLFNEASCVPEHDLPYLNKFIFCFSALAVRTQKNPVTCVALTLHL